MNKKYLFGMLLSGALLTACTADDALDAAKVAKKGEMAAPVFTVSKDDGNLQNRAEYVPGGTDNRVKFELDDKLSLFHGITSENLSTVKGYQNAIYLADDEKDGKLSFHTFSMVQPGYAIMIYPADLGFGQMDPGTNTGKAAPVVTIDPVQDATMKERTPYISEFLNLQDDDDLDEESQAGFGKTYDIMLRRAAGTLRAQLSLKNKKDVDGADPVEVRAVQIQYPNQPLFATKIAVKADGENDIQEGKDLRKNHDSWYRKSELDLENIVESIDSLKTKDVTNNIATFTILPAGPVEGEVKVTKGNVKIYTNYGIVTLKTDEDKVFGADKKVLDGPVLQELADKLYKVGKEGETEFVGQGIGGAVGTTIEVDMNKLNLNGLHIDNEKDLITALKVYDALYQDKKDEVVNLILDGKSGKLEMSAETLAELSKHMTAGTGLKISACTITAEKLTTIKATSTTETEVPSLVFAGVPTGTVALELAGPWKWTDVTVVNRTDNSKDKCKKMTGVTGITFLSGAVVNLKNNIAVKSGELTNGITVNNGATVNATGVATDVYLTLKNNGVININADCDLRAADGGVIENCAEPQAAANKPQLTGLTASKYGVINNSGTLGIVTKTTGQVNNYGTIDIKTYGASTLVSTNARTGALASKKYGETIGSEQNYFGTIIIDNANEMMTTVSGEQGFIKKTVTNKKPTNLTVGDLANYIILDGECEEITGVELDDKTKETGVCAGTDWNKGVKYIEVKTKNTIRFTGSTTMLLKGLIVPTGCKVYVERGTTVKFGETTGTIYKKGSITTAGTVQCGNDSNTTLKEALFSGYFGTDGQTDVTVQ